MSADILGTNCDQCVSMVECCFTSTETVRLIRDGEPRTPTSTLTQLLNSGTNGADSADPTRYKCLSVHTSTLVSRFGLAVRR